MRDLTALHQPAVVGAAVGPVLPNYRAFRLVVDGTEVGPGVADTEQLRRLGPDMLLAGRLPSLS